MQSGSGASSPLITMNNLTLNNNTHALFVSGVVATGNFIRMKNSAGFSWAAVETASFTCNDCYADTAQAVGIGAIANVTTARSFWGGGMNFTALTTSVSSTRDNFGAVLAAGGASVNGFRGTFTSTIWASGLSMCLNWAGAPGGILKLEGVVCNSPTNTFWTVGGANTHQHATLLVDLAGVASTGTNGSSVPVYKILDGATVLYKNGVTNFTAAGGVDYQIDASLGGSSATGLISDTLANLVGFSPRCNFSFLGDGTGICAN